MKPKIKFEVEYEITPIRFIKATCPECGHVFNGREHGTCEDGSFIHDAVDLQFGKFKCPECGHRYETRDEEIEIKGS